MIRMFLGAAIASACVRNELPSITAPMKLEKSRTSPMAIVEISDARVSFNWGHRLEGTYIRDDAEHFCPWYSKDPLTAAAASASTSADG